MLCQTIHVWITYIQPTVTYILHCYARPCLEHITSNWWWRMSSLSHSSQWRMSSLSHSSTLHLYFERQTLSASQTFVWRNHIFFFISRLCLLVRPLSGAIGTQCIWLISTGLLHKSSRSWSESISNYLLAIFTLLGVSFSFLPNLGVCLSCLIF